MLRKFMYGAFGVAGCAVAGSALAVDSHQLNVSAEVAAVCRFVDAGPTTLTISNNGTDIDPSVNQAATGSVPVNFRCTRGTTSTVTADLGGSADGTTRRLANGTEFLPYALSLVGDAQPGGGHGANNDRILTVNASIAVADFQDALAGTYSDTVTLTINP